MGIFANRYLVSQDPARFNKHQSIDEQRAALMTLSYGWGRIRGETGQIEELRLSILKDHEALPGRTSDESLMMVEEALGKHRQRAGAHLAERNAREWVIYRNAGIFLFAATIAVFAPSVARTIGG